MLFDGRELKPYAEPVAATSLRVGGVYFSVQYVDEDMLIPLVEAWVFAGKGLDPEDTEAHFYFEDVESYLAGMRYRTATDENATFQLATENSLNHIFEYESALDELMRCSIRRKQKKA
jgi:hypothetical protein